MSGEDYDEGEKVMKENEFYKVSRWCFQLEVHNVNQKCYHFLGDKLFFIW